MRPLDRKAISPTISTVVMVAVTIAVTLSVTYWASGVVSSVTRIEKIELMSGYMVRDTVKGSFNLSVNYRSTGSSDTTITDILINGKPLNTFWSPCMVNNAPFRKLEIGSGSQGRIIICFPDRINGATNPEMAFSSGQMVELSLLSASGARFPLPVAVP